MKKNQFFVLLCIGILLVVILFFGWSFSQKRQQDAQKIADMQEVHSITEQEDTTPVSDSEKPVWTASEQIKLDQIKDNYTAKEQEYKQNIVATLQKYKASFSQENGEDLDRLLQEHSDMEVVKQKIQEKYEVTLLRADLQHMIDEKYRLDDEKILKKSRLGVLEQQHDTQLQKNKQELIVMVLAQALEEQTDISAQKKKSLLHEIEKTAFSQETFWEEKTAQQQEKILRQAIDFTIKIDSSLSGAKSKLLIQALWKEIMQAEIFPQAEQEDTSLSLNFNSLNFLRFPSVFAEDATLTPEKRSILMLKTQIAIDQFVQENIKAEISFHAKSITSAEYETLIAANLERMEELLIFQATLQDGSATISLEDLEKYNLGAYKDDSEIVQDLPVLAYIQEKTGHIMLKNLHSTTKLGESNDSLYAGYGIETLSGSTATIVFSDDSILRLEPLSQVLLKAPSESEITVQVEKGSIWTRVLQPLVSGETFTIESEGISLGVRGTALYFSHNTEETLLEVVDSYTSDGSSSVRFTDTNTGESEDLSAGQELIISEAGRNINNVDTTKLYAQKAQIASYQREDLEYLSLLLDDRQRGIHNSPLALKHSREGFLEKISGELEASRPKNSAEAAYIFENPELHSVVTSTGSMYYLLKKDELISAIKNSSIADKKSKITVVKDMYMPIVEEKLGSKRAIQDLFDLHIAADFAKNPAINSNAEAVSALKYADMTARRTELADLVQSSQKLSLPRLVSHDISLVTFDPDTAVTIEWKSLHPEYISKTGVVVPQDKEKTTILTAKLSKGPFSISKDFVLTLIPRELTQQEQLQAAAAYMKQYITGSPKYGKFTDEIDVPSESDFRDAYYIFPYIDWSGAGISSSGNLTRPSYNAPGLDVDGFLRSKFTATLTHPDNPDVQLEQEYDVDVQRKACLPPHTIIGGSCYELLAKAEYNTPGKYNLELPDGGSITADVGPGVDDNSKDLDAYYTGLDFSVTDLEKSLVELNGETGILLDNDGSDDYLSYDLSSLPLGDDWAIEMSVWGGDLKRRTPSDINTYYLLASPSTDGGNFAINSGFNKLRFIYSGVDANESNTSAIGNQYYRVVFNRDIHYIDGFTPIQSNNTTLNLADTIKIGSSHMNDGQWNGIINNFTIYKKN